MVLSLRIFQDKMFQIVITHQITHLRVDIIVLTVLVHEIIKRKILLVVCNLTIDQGQFRLRFSTLIV
jgi:hypothetical protein